MREDRGATLITILIMVLIMLIIASIAIIGGKGLLHQSQDSAKQDRLMAVKAVVNDISAKYAYAGVMVPANVEIYGKPIASIAEFVTEFPGDIVQGWYLLEQNDLENMGVKYVDEVYVVNYEQNKVLTLNDFIEEVASTTIAIVAYSNDEDDISKTSYVNSGKPFILTNNGLSKEGYMVTGYSLTPDGQMVYEVGKSYMITDPLTLYAIWGKSGAYTIRFYANGGLGTMNSQVVTLNQTQQLAKNTYRKENAIFSSWNTKEDGTGDSYANGAVVMNLTEEMGGVVNLYAQWNMQKFTQTEPMAFDGTSIVDTGVKLFTPENAYKNYMISFVLESYDENFLSEHSNSTEMPTIMNALDESQTTTGYPGILLRYNSTFKIVANENTINKTEKEIGKNLLGKRVTFVKQNGSIYYVIGDDMSKYVKILTYQNTIPTFDLSVTFGASLDARGNPMRYFKGVISDIKVELSDNDFLEISNGKYMVLEQSSNAYVMSGTAIFDNSNYINTGLNLFSEENKDKDFEISFMIVSSSDGNGSMLNAMDEKNTPALGFTLKNNSSQLTLTSRSKSDSNNSKSYTKFSEVRIIRRNGVIYANTNNNVLVKRLDFSDLENTFNIPLSFGASIDAEGNAFNYSVCTLKDISVRIGSFLPSETIENREVRTSTSYRLDGKVEFNGKNYINTGLYLFSTENINKDFEISFDVYADYHDTSGQFSMASAMNEAGSPWPGFVFRKANHATNIELVANKSSSVKEKRLTSNVDQVNHIVIKRIDGKLYGSLDGSELREVVDLTGMTNTFNVPLTFGSNINGRGAPDRFFKGILENINVVLYDE